MQNQSNLKRLKTVDKVEGLSVFKFFLNYKL